MKTFYQTVQTAEGNTGCCQHGTDHIDTGSCVADKAQVDTALAERYTKSEMDVKNAALDIRLWDIAQKSRIYLNADDYNLKISVDEALNETFTRFYANTGVMAPDVQDNFKGYAGKRWYKVIAANDDFTKCALLTNGNYSYGNMEQLGRSDKTMHDLMYNPAAPFKIYELYPNLKNLPYWNCIKSPVYDRLLYGRDDMFGVQTVTLADENGQELVGLMPDGYQAYGFLFETHGNMYYDTHADAMWVELRNDDAYLNVGFALRDASGNIVCLVEAVGTDSQMYAYTFIDDTKCFAARDPNDDHQFSLYDKNKQNVGGVTAVPHGFSATKSYDSVMLRRITPVFLPLPAPPAAPPVS
jgi:hypothetical protein